MIEVPDLRGNVLAGRHAEQLHALAVTRVEALLGRLVDDLALLGVGPLLVAALAVARRHLHLLARGGEGVGDRGAGVLPPHLEHAREGEELRRGHEVVAHVLAQLVTAMDGIIYTSYILIQHHES